MNQYIKNQIIKNLTGFVWRIYSLKSGRIEFIDGVEHFTIFGFNPHVIIKFINGEYDPNCDFKRFHETIDHDDYLDLRKIFRYA